MTVNESVGRAVHHAMWDRKVTQVKLADALGIDQSTLSKKLRGRVTWTAGDVVAAAVLLQLDPGKLLPAGTTAPPGDDDSGVRRQGLEPRTRWYRALSVADGLRLAPAA